MVISAIECSTQTTASPHLSFVINLYIIDLPLALARSNLLLAIQSLGCGSFRFPRTYQYHTLTFILTILNIRIRDGSTRTTPPAPSTTNHDTTTTTRLNAPLLPLTSPSRCPIFIFISYFGSSLFTLPLQFARFG